MVYFPLRDNTVSVYMAPMTYTETLAAFVAETTQAKFATDAGITQASVSRYLAGERFPNRDAAEKIERASDGKVPLALWQLEAAHRYGIAA